MLAPVLFATLSPPEAVLVSALLWIAQSAVMTARGRDAVLRRELRWLLALGVPGLVAGALVLRVASADALRVAVGVAVLAAVGARRFVHPHHATRAMAWPAGFLAGALTTSLTTNGPPLVLYLSARGATPAQLRATLAAAFLALDALAAVPLALTGTLDAPPLAAVLALVVAFPPGLALGLWLAPRIADRVQVAAVTVLLVALGLASLLSGLA